MAPCGKRNVQGLVVPGITCFLYWGFRLFTSSSGTLQSSAICSEMKVFSDLHRICACRNVCFHRTDVVVAIVCHHVVGCDESRYISACLFRQQVIDFPVIRFASGAADCLVDSTWATVIGCYNQIPVSINIVHLFQVTGGSPGCLIGSRRSSIRLLDSRP